MRERVRWNLEVRKRVEEISGTEMNVKMGDHILARFVDIFCVFDGLLEY